MLPEELTVWTLFAVTQEDEQKSSLTPSVFGLSTISATGRMVRQILQATGFKLFYKERLNLFNAFQQIIGLLSSYSFAITFLKAMRQFCLQNFITLPSICRDGHWLSVP